MRPARAALRPTARSKPLDMADVASEAGAAEVPAGVAEEPGQDLLAEFYAAAQERATENEKPLPWTGEQGWQKLSTKMVREQFPGLREDCKRKGLVVESYFHTCRRYGKR